MNEYFDLLDKSIAEDKKFFDSISSHGKVIPKAKENWENALNKLAKPFHTRTEEKGVKKMAPNYTSSGLMILFAIGIATLIASLIFPI